MLEDTRKTGAAYFTLDVTLRIVIQHSPLRVVRSTRGNTCRALFEHEHCRDMGG